MGFRQRLGTALGNMNDILTYGHVREDNKPAEHVEIENGGEEIDLEDEVIKIRNLPDGWDIKK